MKIKNLIKFLSLTLLFNVFFSSAQVGIGTTAPNATLDVQGQPTALTVFDGIIPPRLTGEQLGAKIYTTNQTGAVVYATAGIVNSTNPQVSNVINEGLYYFDGNKWQIPDSRPKILFGTLGNGITTEMLNFGYTGSYIELPPGDFLVYVQLICTKNVELVDNESYFARCTFTDSSTSQTSSSDIQGNDLISKDCVGPGFYYVLSGNIRIKNTSNAKKKYYLWKIDCGSYGSQSSTSSKFFKFGARASVWKENTIYAIPINL